MIVVKIELWSAITHQASEIGRMYIANDGSGTATRGSYDVAVCRRGTQLIPMELNTAKHVQTPKAARTGKVADYPRLVYNIWRLITRACLAAFPEELRAKSTGVHASLSPDVMRGLHSLARRCEPEFVDNDEEAAREWLDAARLGGAP